MIKIDTNRTCFESAKIITNHQPIKPLWQLECDEWQAIKIALGSTLCYKFNPNSKEFDEAMAIGMNGRICDLEDTIKIEYVKH